MIHISMGNMIIIFLALSHLYTKCEMFVNCDIFQHFHNEMIEIFCSNIELWYVFFLIYSVQKMPFG